MAPKIRVEKELSEGRVFVAAHDMQVEIHVTEEGIGIETVKGNITYTKCFVGKDYINVDLIDTGKNLKQAAINAVRAYIEHCHCNEAQFGGYGEGDIPEAAKRQTVNAEDALTLLQREGE